MGLFGNEAKKQAKRRSVDDWMLWSYEIRVASNEAATAVASGLAAGHSATDLAMRLFMMAWEGAAREAVHYYPQHQVQAAYEDQSLRKRAVALLTANQVNQTLRPPFTPELVRLLQASLPEAAMQVARDVSFWSGTKPLDAESLDDVLRAVSIANTRPELTLHERDQIADGALAWVDLNEPARAFQLRDLLIQSEVARHLRQLRKDRSDVDDDLVIAKTLSLLLAFVQDHLSPHVTGDTMAGYFDRGIPSIVSSMFNSLREADAVGFGSAN